MSTQLTGHIYMYKCGQVSEIVEMEEGGRVGGKESPQSFVLPKNTLIGGIHKRSSWTRERFSKVVRIRQCPDDPISQG